VPPTTAKVATCQSVEDDGDDDDCGPLSAGDGFFEKCLGVLDRWTTPLEAAKTLDPRIAVNMMPCYDQINGKRRKSTATATATIEMVMLCDVLFDKQGQ
jgi:hypothetical protein